MKRRKSKQQVRNARDHAAAKQLQTVKDGIAHAAALLVEVQDNLGEAGSFVFVCIQALQAKGGDDANADIATVLGIAYTKLVLDVNQIVREALKALSQGGGK